MSKRSTAKIHRLVFLNYLKVVKGYGEEEVKYVSKGRLYELAGEPFGYDAMVSGRIIRKWLKTPRTEMIDIFIDEKVDLETLEMVTSK